MPSSSRVCIPTAGLVVGGVVGAVRFVGNGLTAVAGNAGDEVGHHMEAL